MATIITRQFPYRPRDRVLVQAEVASKYGSINKIALTTQPMAAVAFVTLTIDADALFEFMASRAVSTKSGRSELQDGIVTAVVVSRKVEASGPPEDTVRYDGYTVVEGSQREVAKALPYTPPVQL
jgi:hypothetical protein